MEVGTNTGSGDELVEDNTGPACVWFEINQKSEAEGHDAHSYVYSFFVAAGLIDDDSYHCGCEG